MFESFQDFIPRTIKSLNLEKQTVAAHIIFLIEKEITDASPRLKDQFKIISFQNKTLKIFCKHPVISQEIMSLQSQIKTNINSKFKKQILQQIFTTTQIQNKTI